MILAGAALALMAWSNDHGAGGGSRIALAVTLAALFLAAKGALLRLATGVGRPGRGGLQWGRTEARLLAVWALTALFLGVLALLFFVIVLCFAYAAASAGHGFVASDISTWAPAVERGGRWLVTAVGLGAAGLLVWAALRVSLAAPATVASGRVRMLETWPLTRGRVLALAAAFTLVGAPPLALASLCLRLARAGQAGGIPLYGVAGALVAGLWLPMTLGLMACFLAEAPEVTIP